MQDKVLYLYGLISHSGWVKMYLVCICMKFLLHPAGVTYDLGRGGGIICPTWHRTAIVHCITLYKQVQAITDKYRQIQANTINHK